MLGAELQNSPSAVELGSNSQQCDKVSSWLIQLVFLDLRWSDLTKFSAIISGGHSVEDSPRMS